MQRAAGLLTSLHSGEYLMSDYHRWLERKRRAVKSGAHIRSTRRVIIDDIRVRARVATSWDEGFYQLAHIHEAQLREMFQNEKNKSRAVH